MADENPSESQLTPLGEANARYERLVELPSISSVSFTDSHTVQLHLAYKDHANLTKHVKTGSVVLDDSGKVVTTTPLVRRDASVKDEFAVRGMKKWKVFLREEGEGKKRRFVDVWNEQSSTRMYSVEVSDVHGAFAVDDVFSTSSAFVSGDSQGRFHILYSATLNEATHDAIQPDPLSRFAFQPPIGEKYRRSFRPAVFVLRVGGEQATTIQQLQPQKEGRIWSSAALLPSDARSGAPTHAVAVAHDTLPNQRRLGQVFCTNRPTSVWVVPLPADNAERKANSAIRHDKLSKAAETFSTQDSLETGEATRLSSSDYSARSPRLAPVERDGSWSLIWLETPLGGPHSTASHIAFARGRGSKLTIGGRRLMVSREDASAMSVDQNVGLYIDQLAAQPFFTDVASGEELFGVTTIDGSRRRALVFDLTGRERHDVEYGWQKSSKSTLSWTFLAGEEDGARFVVQSSGPAQPPRVHIVKVAGGGVEVFAVDVAEKDAEVRDIESSILRIPGTALSTQTSSDAREIEAILVRPAAANGAAHRAAPCILFPHGGPHSTTTTDWSAPLTAMVLSGYSVVLPNYHGSLGRSPAFVDALIGRCGHLDIEDCLKTIDHVVAEGIADANNVYYQGGSHGGFIGAHLLAREPGRWKAVALRNPVTHIGDMFAETDIPDWCLSECGEEYAFDRPPTVLGKERYGKLHDASPLPYVEGRAMAEAEQTASVLLPPTLLLVASSDQRVPPKQGLQLYHALRERERRQGEASPDAQHLRNRAHCCWFEDPDAGHGLESIEAARGAWGATWEWFRQWAE